MQEREREKIGRGEESEFMCVREREWGRVILWVCERERERMGKRVIMVCVREREDR